MRILAIDPGCEKSAYVIVVDGNPVTGDKIGNAELLARLAEYRQRVDRCVIEMIASYGMAVGKEVFETVVFIGRLMERWEATAGFPADRLYRRDVKLAICHHARATDSNIRTELVDRFGPGKEKAIGSKGAPGPLYGYKADVWAALALAITFGELQASSNGNIKAAP